MCCGCCGRSSAQDNKFDHARGLCSLCILEEDIGKATVQLREQFAEGYKSDAGKLRMDLIPPEAVESLARVLTYGATGVPFQAGCAGKSDPYPERNWERGMAWSRVFAAINRHLWSWWAGEECDRESGLSGIEHVLCCAAFLVAYEKRHAGTDDRPKIGAKEECGDVDHKW